MKKIILVAAFAMLTVFGAFAQDNDEKVYLNPVTNIRIGYAGVLNADKNLAGGVDVGVNMFEVGVRPYDSGKFSLGADVIFDSFRAKDGYYFNSVAHKTELVPGVGMKKLNNSHLNICSFAFPLNFTQTFGDKLNLTIGASAKVNLNADTSTEYTNATDDRSALSVYGVETRRISYDIHLSVTYDDFGIYASYSPMSVFQNGNGPAFSFFTVGAIFTTD
ncbi:MAG: hypothetical protein J6Y88_04020 [Bacteroidales bacterium]|nr:hypothetical protein [Bacteroidales bacterium]